MEAQALVRPKTERMALLRRLRAQPAVFWIGMIVVAVHLLVAATGPLWTPHAYQQMRVGGLYEPPSAQHWLGTDNLGRDVFSRVVYGERIVLALALSATSLAVGVGTLLGMLLGYMRGLVDQVAMRMVEIVLSIPPLIGALLIVGSTGSNPVILVLTVAFFYIPVVANVVRSATLDIVTEDFVTAARLRGESPFSVAIRELLPNVQGIVLVEFSLRTGYAVIFIGGLGFLGFGVAPPTPEWGLMINEGREYITSAPWSVVGPSLAIASLVIGLSFFTDGLGRMLGLQVGEGRTTA